MMGVGGSRWVFFFYKYLQTKHKKWIFSATIHLTRKNFIFPGRYLKGDHFEKKLDMGGGPFKNAKGQGGLKTMNVKPNLQTLKLSQSII